MERLFAKMTLPAYRLYWRVWKPKTTRVRAVLLCGDEVLLVKHIGKSYWNLPSGKVEEGESLYEALRRELHEELGIKDFSIKTLLGTYRQKTNTRDDTVYVFVCHISKKPLLRFEWEIDDARWYSLATIPVTTQKGAKQRIQEYRQGKEGVYLPW
jgi:8-oxo-dGTP pyrophosphatase MutT (NUDIX family)